MYKLKKSKVVFYPATHTYLTPDGRMLDGMGHRTKRILRIERKEYQTY